MAARGARARTARLAQVVEAEVVVPTEAATTTIRSRAAAPAGRLRAAGLVELAVGVATRVAGVRRALRARSAPPVEAAVLREALVAPGPAALLVGRALVERTQPEAQ